MTAPPPFHVDEKSKRIKQYTQQFDKGSEFKLDADTLKGCGCFGLLIWSVGWYILFQYGCVGPSPQESSLEKANGGVKTQVKDQKQQIDPNQEQRLRALTENLAAQEGQRQRDLERERRAAEEKSNAQMRRLQTIRNSPPQDTMIQCATYLNDYNPELARMAMDARNAWQQAAFEGNLSAMRSHYAILQGLLGREFLGYYWDVDDIMRDENKIKKILADSVEFRRKNRR